MRYLYPALALLLGLILLGFGIGQLNADPETHTVETQGAEDAPFTVVSDDLIDSEEGFEEFTIEAEGEFSLAVGRTYDVEAWTGEAAHNRVTGFVEADGEETAHIEAEHVEGEMQAPNPRGSDLWVATETAEDDLLYRWSTPDDSGDWSLLIFRDGEQPAPASITTEQVEPQSQVPGTILVIAGALALLLSVGLFYRAANARRRSSDSDDDTPEGSSPDGAGADSADSKEQDIADAEADPEKAAERPERTDFSGASRSVVSALTTIVVAAGSAVGLAGPAHAEETATEQPDESAQESEPADAEVS